MAARNLYPLRTLVRELIPIAGSFAPNSSSTVALTSRKGLGYSVVRTSTGLFTITLTDAFNDVVCAEAMLQLGTSDDKLTQLGTVVLTGTTPVVQIRVWDISGAAVADVSANAANRVSFVIWARNSASPPTYGD